MRAPRAAAVAALAAMVLVGSACGGSDSGSSEFTATPTTGAGATTTPAITDTTLAGSTTGDDRMAQDGDSVTVHYTGTLDDGTVFDSSLDRDPLPFVIGSGEVISGFDDGVRGLRVGESRTVRIEPEEAYGPVREDLIIELPAADAPEGLAVGDQVTMSNGQPATILEMNDEIVRVDVNHPLAGQALTFEIELVSIA